MSRQPRFEVVHSDHGWFARFRAANGRKVWQTEVYTRRAAAEDAMWLLRDLVTDHYDRRIVLEVRNTDERTTAVTS